MTNRFARSDGPVSKAEYAVFAALSQTETVRGMTTQDTVILRMTIPDFLWREKKKAVYLDGAQVHGSDKQMAKDAEIDELMELAEWEVLRIKYDPPLTGTALAEVVNKIKQFIGE